MSRLLAASLASICEALDVSARSLQVAFRSVTGLGPCAYGRLRRLHAARRDLLAAAPGVHVTGVALRHGFAHFGRFSIYYHELFGEAPSATLRRAAASETAPAPREPQPPGTAR